MSRGDDDMLKRMFASFVERKINPRPQSSGAAGSSSRYPDSSTSYPMSPPSSPQMPMPPASLRRTASAHPRAAPSGAPSYPQFPPQQPPVHPNSHSRTTHLAVAPYGATSYGSGPNPSNANLGTGPTPNVSGVNKSLASLLSPSNNGSAHTGPSAVTAGAAAAAVRNRARDGSRGSMAGGSNASDDATGVRPPRKRTRTNTNTLMRTRSAHASVMPNGTPWPGSQTPMKNTGGGSVGSAPGSPSISQPGSFPCDECGSVFTQRGQLSRHHRRVHEKLRPHACEHCGRLFGARSDRSRHVQIVHKMAPR